MKPHPLFFFHLAHSRSCSPASFATEPAEGYFKNERGGQINKIRGDNCTLLTNTPKQRGSKEKEATDGTARESSSEGEMFEINMIRGGLNRPCFLGWHNDHLSPLISGHLGPRWATGNSARGLAEALSLRNEWELKLRARGSG